MVFIDKFGVTQFNDTKVDGIVWDSWVWHNEIERTIKSYGRWSRDEDKKDPTHMSHLHCHSTRSEGNKAKIYGNGEMRLYGDHPRFYLNKRSLIPIWNNVEMTCYAKLNDPKSDADYVSFRLATRSNHHADMECVCNGLGYGLEWRINDDNKLWFRKEIIHSHNTIQKVIDVNGDEHAPSGGNDLKRWIGMKFIIKTLTDNSVRLQAFTDMNNGVNGGSWVKQGEYIDNGNWSITDPKELDGIESTIAKCKDDCIDPKPVAPYNTVITRPGISSYLRTDYVDDIRFKWFSVREIN